METVIINNQRDIEINEERINLVSKYLFSQLEKNENSELNIVFIGKTEIQAVNKKYRGVNEPTDVLSFSYRTDKDVFSFIGKEEEFRETYGFFTVGEILLCPAVADERLKTYENDWTLEKVLIFLIIHGILHIYGYLHDTDDDRSKMEKEQVRLLELAEKKFSFLQC